MVGQENLKLKLSSAFSQYTLYRQNPLAERPVVLTYGPSGSGKTFAIELLIRKFEQVTGQVMPYSIASSAGISPPGYRGKTLLDVMIQHWLDWKTDEGIIFLDEIDKWCRMAIGSNSGEEVSQGIRSQAEILKYVERDRVTFIDDAKDIEALEDVVFESKKIFWILAGAFLDIDKVIHRRMPHIPLTEGWSHAIPDDFNRFGMIQELTNRVGTWAWVEPLKAPQIQDILRQQELPRWQLRFRALDCELDLDEGALGYCALEAWQQGTGARGAASILRRAMDDVFTRASTHKMTHARVDSTVVRTGRLEILDARDTRAS